MPNEWVLRDQGVRNSLQNSSQTIQPKQTFEVGNDSGVQKKILFGGRLAGKPNKPAAKGITRFRSPGGDEFWIDEEQYSMHVLLLGGIGSGKSNTFYNIIQSIQSTATDKDVIIIFDSKGDFYKRFYRPNDIVIGSSEQFRNQSAHWNIYAEIMGGMPSSLGRNYAEVRKRHLKEWELNAKEIMKAMFKSRRSETQPFFADAAADLITKKIISDLREGDLNKLHTYELKRFLERAAVENYDQYILHSGNDDFKSAKMYYGEGKTPQALAVFAYISGLVQDCFISVFGGDGGGWNVPEFSMRDLVRSKGGRTVFVEYDLSVGEVLSPIYQILYDQALKEALGRSEQEKGNIYLICDEFKLLGKLDHIDDGLNFGRSLGVKICAGLQSVNQVYDLYGEEKGKAILSGFSNGIFFRTNATDNIEYISERFGNNYVDISFWNEVKERTHVQRESKVVEKWDVIGLKRGEAIVDMWHETPEQPFKFRFSQY